MYQIEPPIGQSLIIPEQEALGVFEFIALVHLSSAAVVFQALVNVVKALKAEEGSVCPSLRIVSSKLTLKQLQQGVTDVGEAKRSVDIVNEIALLEYPILSSTAPACLEFSGTSRQGS